MFNFPKITIITPSFNQGQYIEQTIQSVLDQNYPNLEYIIIDGGSTDNTVEIIRKYEKDITYWISEPDKGQSDAINKGLKLATGEIINWLNSDDYYELGALFKIADKFKDSSINVVSGKGRLFENLVTIGYTKGVDVYENNLAKTIGWLRMDQPETFYRKKVIDNIGSLNTALHYLMDRDWWLKYLLLYGLGGVKSVNNVFVHFRLHHNSKTVSENSKFDQEHHLLFFALAKMYDFKEYASVIEKTSKIDSFVVLPIHPKIDKDIIDKAFHYYFLLRANINYELSNKKLANYFYDLIDENKLEDDDKIIFRKFQTRNQFPIFFIKLIRIFTRITST